MKPQTGNKHTSERAIQSKTGFGGLQGRHARACLQHAKRSKDVNMDKEAVKAQLRAEDLKCANPASAASRNCVDKLKALPLANKAAQLAAYSGSDCPNLIRCALAAGTPVDALFGELQLSALCVAAHEGSERALKALLAGGASVELKHATQGFTALHYAAMKNQVAFIDLLLDAGAELEVTDLGLAVGAY
jgi:ankyrin repeat protein